MVNEHGTWKCDMYAGNFAVKMMGKQVPGTLTTTSGVPIYR